MCNSIGISQSLANLGCVFYRPGDVCHSVWKGTRWVVASPHDGGLVSHHHELSDQVVSDESASTDDQDPHPYAPPGIRACPAFGEVAITDRYSAA